MRPRLSESPPAEPAASAAGEEASVDVEPSAPPAPETQKEPWGWTPLQRLGLGLLLLAGVVLVGVQYVRRPFRIGDPVTVYPGRVAEFEERLDPNRADVASLLRVPGMDEKTAQAIVEYRAAHQAEYAGGTVFQVVDDLRNVPVGRRAISRKKVEQLRDFLTCPGDATQPAAGPRGLIPPKVVSPTQPIDDAE